MKILICGGHGQLGHDTTTLLSKNHEVISCSSEKLDIGNHKMVEQVVNRYQPEVIVNCAAYTAVDNCETEKELAWRVNALGPENLAVNAETVDSRLIHISTDYVFDGKKPTDTSYLENDQVQPLSEYGKSKLAGEDAIMQFASNPLIMRTAWLYGHAGNNFLKTMLRLALADPTRELKVVNDQYGSLTWTNSLARQIENVLNADIMGIVHATATGASTWYEGACYFLDAMNVPYTLTPCTTAEYPTPAHRPSNSILANKRLNEAGLSVLQSWRKDIDCFVQVHGAALLKEFS
jgi:dTDP-4-dehydrorhamnose reductase